MKKYSKAVVIGRFNPGMHKGHIELVRKGLEVAEKVIILVGSADRFPDVKNPIGSTGRISHVRDVVCSHFHDDRYRVTVLGLDDYNSDEKWKTEVRSRVGETQTDNIAMIGYEKDQDSYWLKEFDWDLVAVEPYMVNHYGRRVPMSSTFIRDSWLRTGEYTLRDALPIETRELLEDFMDVNEYEYARLREERRYWDKELEKFESYPYAASLNHCTADAVVLCNNNVLLIQRKFTPGKGALALPGGHKDSNETFRYAALRELEEEVNLKVPAKVIRGSIRDSHLFDNPNRSPVFSKPTVAQYIVLQPDADGTLPKVRAASDAKAATWYPLHWIRKNRDILFEDHYQIIEHFTGI
ncbi:MAG: NUDIX domain-containing protein [Bacilli bacterium]